MPFSELVGIILQQHYDNLKALAKECGISLNRYLTETSLKHHPRQRLTKDEVDALNSLVYARTDLIKITSVLSQKTDEGASFSSPPALACQHHYAFHLFTCVHCMRWKRSVLRKLLAL